ncbi:xanthine permease [Saccharopolyspora antimicrobica]|uniref:Xanthine permease n=1 Tax=Saccharopolyspora antimicrobica TaxID=455193 RepID=A0A1I4S1T5_9PSEU|nr:nucleobase:cation symporter-2 family protein [Saccharopolyspora antimicrobica]RKT87539.1 xanthine permease [Saccharopolyspora antimicrobica]SFM58193.1 xanthine permease [Saccharopolyspora antimicrobica]
MRLRPRPRSTAPPDAVDTVPPLRQLLPLGLQHVLVAYSGMATVPLLIGLGIGLPTEQIALLVSANVLVSGIATLLQALGVLNIGARLPIVMGSTFTGITPAILVGKDGGLPAVFGATIVAGLLTWIVAPWFSRLMRFFPPIVTGTIIAIIGFSLLPSTSKLIAGTDPTAADFASPTRLLMALGTILLVVLLEAFAPVAVARFAILIALVLGTLLALPLGLADFSSVDEASWFGAVHPFAFGLPEFTIAAILPMIIIQLVNMVESTGDTLAIGQIAGRDVGRDDLSRALRADGVGTAFAGVFNSFTIVTFGENVGLVSMTRVLSRYVVATAGALLVVIGLLPKLGAVVASLPGPVLGGVGVVMFGTVGAIGVKIMAQADLGNPRNILIVAISFGFGLLPVGAPEFYANLPGVLQPVLSSGIAAGGIAAFLLNLVLNRRTS